MPTPQLKLKGFVFQELFTSDGLKKLDGDFLNTVHHTDELLHGQLLSYRQGEKFTPVQVSELIIQCASLLEAFIAELFGIEEAVERLQTFTLSNNPIFVFKKYYVLRQARRALRKLNETLFFSELDQWLSQRLAEKGLNSDDRELAVATWGQQLLAEPSVNQMNIDRLTQWCVAAMTQEAGQQAVGHWESFHLPKHLDYEHLVDTVSVSGDPLGRLEGAYEYRYRNGFRLTDHRMSERQALDQIHYCVYCHKTDGDFCSKGFPVKKGETEQGFKINSLGNTLIGCPLDEKISEMHVLKKNGYGIGALAVIMIDNPMCPATGHRICNDCVKACIYQKQEPVNIPQTETKILTDILELPWGVEIYDLLTRWNPLRQDQFFTKPYNGKKVLIMGMGPAGFTLAHYLLMEGFAVVGAEGLKIEPLAKKLMEQPIYRYEDLKEQLDNRVMVGFGGVAEYGITVRWDKNFLKLIYINLMRRSHFQVFGSVRFGGTLLVEDVWTLGFDHLAIAVGAGLPSELHIPHSLAPGMRQASDFLMALQLTGAAKSSSLANLQVRLPTVVIGGGLTGIDTATEVQAYYITQVEKISLRYQILVDHFTEKNVRSRFDVASLKILDEFLQHGKRVTQERQLANKEKRQPDFIKLIREWGGVTIAYRRTMQESPAYKRNHEELIKALEEGIYYIEKLEPKSVKLDEYGHIASLACKVCVMDEKGSWVSTDDEQILPARSIFVATGANPNIAYEYEHRGTFLRDGFNYERFEFVDNKLIPVHELGNCKIKNFGPFTSYERGDHRVSFLGDTHPIFHGSVVKAIACAKRTFPKIVASIIKNDDSVGDQMEYQKFRQQIAAMFQAKILAVRRHTSDMVELKVHAPMSARNLRAGQFFRLQNYECSAPWVGGTRLQTEALAMIGTNCCEEPDVISFMIIERGGSSRLVATFQAGQHLSIMGPTGCWSKFPKGDGKTVMIIGGSMAAGHLLSLGPALHANGHRVFYVACMYCADELYGKRELEGAADIILWLTEEGKLVTPGRPQDICASGELISALRDYAIGAITNGDQSTIRLNEIDQVIVVGSTDMIRQVQQSRSGILKDYFSPSTEFVTSVYGPMQCMLKGVCAQCLQWQIDPETGKRTKAVYTCSWQHQPLEKVDIDNIDERLEQNRTQECLTDIWLDYLFDKYKIFRV